MKTPYQIDVFLRANGWTAMNDDRWTNYSTGNGPFEWEQAVAIQNVQKLTEPKEVSMDERRADRADPEIHKFLLSRGWLDHETDDELASYSGRYYDLKGAPPQLSSGHRCWNYTWEQAVAFEYYLFITIGGQS